MSQFKAIEVEFTNRHGRQLLYCTVELGDMEKCLNHIKGQYHAHRDIYTRDALIHPYDFCQHNYRYGKPMLLDARTTTTNELQIQNT